MPDLLKDGVSWLADQLFSNVFVDVFYCRGDDDPIPFKATVGRTLFSVQEEGVSKVVWTDRDFIIKTTDLVDWGIWEPKSGDRIQEIKTVGTQTVKRFFLVAAPDGEQPWRNSDGRDVLTRVHTKLHSEEQIP